MTMDFLRYYVKTVETGSISQAANALFISRQALSKALHHAERELNTTLFTTRSARLELTPGGQALYNGAKAILALWEDTLSQIPPENAARSTLRVGIGRMSYFVWSPDHLQDFNRQQPFVQVLSQSLVSDQLMELLRQGELDAAISNTRIPDPQFRTETLVRRPIYAVVSKNDPLAQKPLLTAQDISLRPNIFIDADRTGADYFSRMMAQLGLAPQLLFCPDSQLTTVFSHVAVHSGVFLTSAIFNSILSPAECVCVPFDTGLPHQVYNMDICLIYPHATPLHSAIQTYKDYLLTHIKDDFLTP